MRRSVGLDFGTTNSALGAVGDDGKVSLARFSHRAGVSDTFRSILYFHPEQRDARGRLAPTGGARAIDRYLEADGSGRLVQSLKSYLADRLFTSTNVFNKMHSLTELMTMLLIDIRGRAEEQMGALGGRIVVGRPVHFTNADTEEDDAFAEARLGASLRAAGWDDVQFEFEPVAAAYYYEQTLDHDELVLIADFGGGTSDFSLIEVGPTKRGAGRRKILGNDGVGIAGDALDSEILHHLVAPMLGMGTTYRSMFGVELPVPVWIYSKLRRWHHLSFLKTKKNIEMLTEILDQSDEPTKIAALLHILDYDLGYHLYRAVERAKLELSTRTETRFLFEDVQPDPAELNGGADVIGAARDALAELEPFTAEAIEAALRAVVEGLGLKPRQGFQPIRIAVTGSKISPGLFESIELLGRAKTLARLSAACGA